MTISRSTRDQAHKNLIGHQFVMGGGYVRHAGSPTVRQAVKDKKSCSPPPKAQDGSLHVLRRAPAGQPVTFSWVAAENAWKPVDTIHMLRGARMAFLPDYLSSVGWEYVGTAKAKK